MPVYSVYEPLVKNVDPGRQVDDVKFVREGFSFFAFLLPWLYFIVKRMWVAFAAYLAIIAMIMGLGYWLELPQWMTQAVSIGVSLLIGLEAQNFYQASLEQAGYTLSDVVAGRKLLECEADYFAAWKPADASSPAMPADGEPMRGRLETQDARNAPRRNDVIGGLEA